MIRISVVIGKRKRKREWKKDHIISCRYIKDCHQAKSIICIYDIWLSSPFYFCLCYRYFPSVVTLSYTFHRYHTPLLCMAFFHIYSNAPFSLLPQIDLNAKEHFLHISIDLFDLFFSFFFHSNQSKIDKLFFSVLFCYNSR